MKWIIWVEKDPGKEDLEDVLKKVKLQKEKMENASIMTPLKYISDTFEDVQLY